MPSDEAMDGPGLPTFDASKLDGGIREAVRLLRRGGFRTFTSCEGGSGHSFRLPTVGVLICHDQADAVESYLAANGVGDFVVTKKVSPNPYWNATYAARTEGQYLWVQGYGLLGVKA